MRNREGEIYTLGAEVEQLSHTGADDFTGTGQGLNNSLTGGAGNDSLSGLAGNDTLIGGPGDDLLAGGTGIDTLLAGTGNDVYQVDAVGDVVIENAGEGHDRVSISMTTPGTFTLSANVEDAVIVGAMAGVNLIGNAEDNTLEGNEAANQLAGLAGDDYLWGRLGNDTLLGGAGNDDLDGGAGSDKHQSYYQKPENWIWQKCESYRDGGKTTTAAGEDAMWTFEPSAALKVYKIC